MLMMKLIKKKRVARAKAYYQANKEKINAKTKAYREANKEKISAQKKAYREANKEKISDKRKAYREANKEERAAYGKVYYQVNKEKRAAYNEANKGEITAKKKAYYKKNKEHIIAKNYTYKIERKKTDILYKLKGDIRSLIAGSFKNQGYSKNTKTANILGCSWEELQSHLGEKTANDHTDHIIPQSWAITEEEIYTLNHYSNLQILSAEENRAKGNRFTRLDNVKIVLSLHPHPKRIEEILDRNQDKIVA